MPRTQGTKIENNFVNGLVTETTALQFPENAARETYDCIFDRTGRVTRRLGFDVEASNSLTSVPLADGEAVTEFLWENVGGQASTSFYVVQTGSILRFYDCATSTSLTANAESFTVDLDNYLPSGSSLDPAVFPCQYAAGNGDLFVVNGAADPFFITYDVDNDTVEANSITIQTRDLVGVPDGLEQDERPTNTESDLASGNPAHYYNLYNQGWFADNIGQWDTAFSSLPSNGDIPSVYRVDDTDSFGTTRVQSRTVWQNSIAPRGHFILDTFAPDRVAAVNAEATYSITAGDTSILISYNYGDRTGMYDTDTNVGKMFDGDTVKSGTSMEHKATATTFYSGKNFGSTGKKRITKARLYATSSGYVASITPNVTFSLRASNTLPSDFAADGTELGTGASALDAVLSTTTPNYVEITSSDTSTLYQYVWIYASHDGAANNFGMSELQFYQKAPYGGESLDVADLITYDRPQTVAFFAQRVWYSGVDHIRHNTTLYFSQLVDTRDTYGKCYQANDPANEDIFDLLASDGGYIRIADIGQILKLFTYQDSLLVFATNGVWQVKGGQAGFAANDFLVRKITSIGIVAASSLVSIQGAPVYWGDDGINTITYQLEADSFVAQSLTDDKIKTFITDIPEYNRKFVKTVYDSVEQKAYTLYNTSTTLATDNAEYLYTNVLVADARTKAFYPWTIGSNDLLIRGIGFVRTADRSSASKVKYTIFENVDASNEKIGFAEVSNTLYKDWTQYAIDVDDSTQEIDYTSYFNAGFYIHNEGAKYFSPTYAVIFMEVEDYSSLFCQGVFDFASSTSSNQYTTAQQCYNDNGNTNLAYRTISMKRQKIRGRGRSLSLRFYSESGKPFNLIGWSIHETANSSV